MGLRRAGLTAGSARGSYVVALSVLVSALLLTAVLYRVTLNSEAGAHQARFTLYAEEVANTLNARFSRYQAILDASAGLYVSSDGHVSRAHWLIYADTIALKQQYPASKAWIT